jgi:hypothetical protein
MKIETFIVLKNNEHRQMFKKVVVVVVCASSRYHIFLSHQYQSFILSL